MAASAIIAGITISIEVAKILIPLIQGWLDSKKDSTGAPLTPAVIAELRTLNDQLTFTVQAELEEAKKL